jgi:hypothetical protein
LTAFRRARLAGEIGKTFPDFGNLLSELFIDRFTVGSAGIDRDPVPIGPSNGLRDKFPRVM